MLNNSAPHVRYLSKPHWLWGEILIAEILRVFSDTDRQPIRLSSSSSSSSFQLTSKRMVQTRLEADIRSVG
jgi:hypothetical protein